MTTSAQVAEHQSSLPTNVLLRTTLNQTIRLHHHEFYTIALAMFDMMTSAVSSLISTAPLRTIVRQYFVFKAIPVLLLLLLLLLVSCLLSRNGLWSTRSPRLYRRIFEHFSLHPSFPSLFEVQQWQVSYNRRRIQLHSSQCSTADSVSRACTIALSQWTWYFILCYYGQGEIHRYLCAVY